jgi:hypothetical protein
VGIQYPEKLGFLVALPERALFYCFNGHNKNRFSHGPIQDVLYLLSLLIYDDELLPNLGELFQVGTDHVLSKICEI